MLRFFFNPPLKEPKAEPSPLPPPLDAPEANDLFATFARASTTATACPPPAPTGTPPRVLSPTRSGTCTPVNPLQDENKAFSSPTTKEELLNILIMIIQSTDFWVSKVRGCGGERLKDKGVKVPETIADLTKHCAYRRKSSVEQKLRHLKDSLKIGLGLVEYNYFCFAPRILAKDDLNFTFSKPLFRDQVTHDFYVHAYKAIVAFEQTKDIPLYSLNLVSWANNKLIKHTPPHKLLG